MDPSALPSLLQTVHAALVFGFIAVTTLLMLMTLANRHRITAVRFTWPTGRLGGLPLWPSIFLVIVLGLCVSALWFNHPWQSVFLGYLMGGLFWFISVMTAQTTVVTEYGIIRNVNQADQAVAWGSIVDYFEIQQGRQSRFVFFHTDTQGNRCRMEIDVPARHHLSFSNLVTYKLDTRFELTSRAVGLSKKRSRDDA